MISKIKIIANYLPQYHVIPENSKFWGEGYTDWVAVEKAVPLFNGHVQPKTPLNSNYYALDNQSTIEAQAKIASDYGLYGFNIYHYWFNSETCLLSKPAELILNSDISIKYMFTWDNASWKRTWSAVRHANDWAPTSDSNRTTTEDDGVLAKLVYGDRQEWYLHFQYLLPYFNDARYIKEGDMPLFGIFNPDNEPKTLKKMISYWNDLAIEQGFKGIKVICKNNRGENKISRYSFTYEPGNSAWETRTILQKVEKRINTRSNSSTGPMIYDYDTVWSTLLARAEEHLNQNLYCGSFVNFDDTPRRSNNGRVIVNSTPDKFMRYMHRLLEICRTKDSSTLFITAWNEWSEGAYLEPDELTKYDYLEALKLALASI